VFVPGRIISIVGLSQSNKRENKNKAPIGLFLKMALQQSARGQSSEWQNENCSQKYIRIIRLAGSNNT
jgi:hypothetical protein